MPKATNLEEVTIIYYGNNDLVLRDMTIHLTKGDGGRVIIPNSIKKGKNIIAVCRGCVEILNRVGDRIIGVEDQLADKVSAYV